jgi:predicted TIM-barrel fold metal-dependent hydrolase
LGVLPAKQTWIDGDVHVLETPDVWKRLPREFQSRITLTPQVDDPYYAAMMPDVAIDGHPIPDWIGPDRKESSGEKFIQRHKERFPRGGGMEPDAVLRDLDVEGIERCALYPTMFLWAAWMPRTGAAFSTALAAAYNDYIYDFCSVDRRRMRPVIVVALHDVAAAIKEIERNAKRGFVGVFVRPNPLYGRTLGHEDYRPLYERMAALGLPLGIHEGSLAYLPTLGADRVTSQASIHILCHPFEQMASMVALLDGGVFERFPTLKVLFLEAGVGWVPYWLRRLDAEREQYRFSGGGLLASEYFERQCYVSAEVNDPLLDSVVRSIGDRRIFLSSDYPHDESLYPNSARLVEELTVAADSKARLTKLNAIDAYPLL